MTIPVAQSVQQIETTIAAGSQSAVQKVTHGLKNMYNTNLTPDMIRAEVVGLSGGEAKYAVVSKIERSAPEDGSFTATIYLNAAAAGTDAKVNVRYTAIYWSGVQGSDHTV
jgi:hypothetical protein